jgi:hypothetical protein
MLQGTFGVFAVMRPLCCSSGRVQPCAVVLRVVSVIECFYPGVHCRSPHVSASHVVGVLAICCQSSLFN